MNDLVSVVIVNYNGKHYLKDCIDSILGSMPANYEIIVADNNSSDDSVPYIQAAFAPHLQKMKFLVLDKNYGPAKARNKAMEIANGKYVAFLDNDTKVDKDWLITAIDLFRSDETIGCIQCKLLLMDQKDRFDYAGEYLDHKGFLVQRALHKEIDQGQHDQYVEILAAKSAGMFIRKDVFEKINGFDEDYFIYVEETDLGWRSWHLGYKTVFCPESIVYHKFSTSSIILTQEKHNYNIRFHGTKNYITTLVKNLSARSMIVILPTHIAIWFLFAFFLIFTGNFRSAAHVIKGISWVGFNIRNILQKRSAIQNSRVLSDNDIFIAHKLMRKASILVKVRQYLTYSRAGYVPD
jgi:GT2 family glycosyltransferase